MGSHLRRLGKALQPVEVTEDLPEFPREVDYVVKENPGTMERGKLRVSKGARPNISTFTLLHNITEREDANCRALFHLTVTKWELTLT